MIARTLWLRPLAKNPLRFLATIAGVATGVAAVVATLLASRAGLDNTPPETLFGDDAEADVLIYCLYADILAGKVTIDELERVMHAARAYPDEIDRTMRLADSLQRRDGRQ